MATIIYTAQRGLIGSHVAGETYAIDIALTDAKRSDPVVKKAQRSLGGAMEVIRNYKDKQWVITFEPVAGDRLNALREFLESTDGGERFQMDIYGTESSLKTMKRTDEGHSEDPFMRRGGLFTDLFQISITTIEV